MTTTKPVVDSLAMQGKGMPENDVPPQTIIPTSIDEDADRLATKRLIQSGIIRPELSQFSVGGIVPDSVRLGLGNLPLPGEHIIPIKVDGGAEGIIRADELSVGDMKAVQITVTNAEYTIGPMSDAIRLRLVEAASRRQSVQAESMVNLAVGIVLTRQGQTSIDISKQDLLDFQQNYTVSQQIGEDGGFIITVTPKE